MNAIQSNYLKIIQQAVSGAGQLTPINSGGLGDFPWFWEDANGNFNLNTFNYINSRVAPMPGEPPTVQLVSPFSNDYLQLLNSIGFQLSVADTNRQNGAGINAGVYATRVVSTYQTNFGAITPADWKIACVESNIDYVINYIVGAIWSGRSQRSKPAFTVQQLVALSDLAANLPDIPAAGFSVLPLIQSYLTNIGVIDSFSALIGGKNKLLTELKNNSQKPSLKNGGMTTRDSYGNDTCHVGYMVSPTPGSIQNNLNSHATPVTIEFSSTQTPSGLLEIKTNNVGNDTIPSEDFISFTNQTGETFNPHTLPGSAQYVNVQLTYQGCTLISYEPRPYEGDTMTDWYFAEVIAEAVDNIGKDITGYRFITTQNIYDYSQGGNFGIVSQLLIADYPTLQLVIATGDYENFAAAFGQPTDWNLTFFGSSIGTHGSYRSSAQRNNTGEGFTVNFRPLVTGISVPDFDQRAYVVGGQILYPAAQT